MLIKNVDGFVVPSDCGWFEAAFEGSVIGKLLKCEKKKNAEGESRTLDLTGMNRTL